jgi:SAM-dependent methyltransferase
MRNWDERYSDPDYVYGTEPNDYLVSVVDRIPRGKVLCLGEGEGRNGVYLARQGCDVTAVDASQVGLDKASRLAADHGVEIRTIVSDLAHFRIEAESWDAIVSIFCHVPPEIRAPLHRRCVEGLKPGGVLVLEAYTPRQIGKGTGGPPSAGLTMHLEILRQELAGLKFVHAVEFDREVLEGKYHTGEGAVVQVLARKPARMAR